MKRKAKKTRGKRHAPQYKVISLTMSREQHTALHTIGEFCDRSVDDVINVLLGVAMFMGRASHVAVATPAPPSPAPAPAAEGAAPVT